MPAEHNINYGGTVTFHSHYSLDQKKYYIDNFIRILQTHLLFNEKSEYFIEVSKEYHKVNNEDDLEAPHLHFIITSYNPIAPIRIKAICKMLQELYGRSQFYRMTKMKTIQYRKYINKDCDRLMKLTGESHYTECYIEVQPKVKLEELFNYLYSNQYDPDDEIYMN